MKVGIRVKLRATGLPGKWEPPSLEGLSGVFLGLAPTGYARVQFDDPQWASVVMIND